MRARDRAVLVIAIIGAMSLALGLLHPTTASAATGIEPYLSFEGKIVSASGQNITDGCYNMEFKIYSGGTATGGGTLKWTEDWLNNATPNCVNFVSGTFQVNLGSINAFGSSVDWNSNPLYLSLNIGTTASCSTTFASCGGGTGEMSPFILLTATPYAMNAGELGGMTASQFGQLAANQTFTGANTFQPTTNATGLIVAQTSAGSPTADIFDVQGSSGGTNNFIQVTSTAANAGAVAISSLGANNNVSVATGGAATTGAITIQTGNATAGASGNVTIDTGTFTSGTPTISIGTAHAAAINIGNASGSLSLTSSGGLNVTSAGAITGVSTLGLSGAITGAVSGNTINGLVVNSGALSSVSTVDASGQISDSANTTALALTGTPTNSATASLLQLAGTISGGNTATNGGTYIGINEPSSGAGNAADFLNFQNNGTSEIKVNSGGSVTANGTFTLAGSSPQIDTGATTTTLTLGPTNATAVLVGSNSTSNTTQHLLQFNSVSTFTEAASCTTSANQGAVYYNTTSNTIRGCVNGNWEDMVSTSGLGIILFGVVPDSSSAGAPGDLGGISGNTNSPCKVYWSAAQQVTVAPCIAYSGGRKVIVAQTNLSTSAFGANAFGNVCLDGANDQPKIDTPTSNTETSAAVPAWSANNPVLCLATVKGASNPNAGNVASIYDIRTFTTSTKTFATTNTATGLGWLEGPSGTANLVAPASATTSKITGVSVAYSGALSSTSINLIIATAGPQWVKAASGSTVGDYATGTTTTGYVIANTTTVSSTGYASVGVAQRTIDTTCTASTNCQFSEFFNPFALR